MCKLEDEHEKFERLQMAVLMANPDSAPFYKAQLRRRRRVRNQIFLKHISHLLLVVWAFKISLCSDKSSITNLISVEV